MVKLLFVAKKRVDLTEDQFITYWRQIHAPMMAALPGVRRYLINAVTPDASLSTADCDGVEEVWFDGLAALQDAVASAAGKTAVADRSRFCAPGSGTAVVEELEIDLGSVAGRAV